MVFKKMLIYTFIIGLFVIIVTKKEVIIKRFISLRFIAYQYHDSLGNILHYRIFKPTLKLNTKYPLILYLHGGASNGKDNLNQLNETIYSFTTNKFQKTHPSFIMAPQCPRGKQWVNTNNKKTPFDHYHQNEIPEGEEMKMIVKVIQDLVSRQPIDKERIYILGFSMGSSGTWDIISRHPEIFAAAAPISGVSDISTAQQIIHIPIWAFHGQKDEIAPVRLNKEMQEAINNAGGNCKLTIFEDLGHSCAKQSIQNESFINWLFSQRKNNLN